MSKRTMRSPIWEFFTQDTTKENVAVCNICKHKLSFKTTTSNLRKHMRLKHPTVNIEVITPKKVLHQIEAPLESEHEEDQEDGEPPTKISKSTSICSRSQPPTKSVDVHPPTPTDQPSSSSSSSGLTTNYNLSNQFKQKRMSEFIRVPKKIPISQKKVIDEALTGMFTKDFQPFAIVEDEGFIGYTKALNPNYDLPTRKTISQSMIPAKFETCLNETRIKLEQALSICITTDCWTSVNTESYIAITAHFIDPNFELQSVLLTCEPMPVSHTAENLAEVLADTFKKWNISNKVELVVSDHASNISKAVKECLKMKHLGCYAHALNLIVKKALEVDDNVSGMLDKIRRIVAYFKRSVNATEKLLDYQKKNCKHVPKKLTMDVATRWNSTFLMLSRFLLLNEAVKSTIAVMNKELPTLTQAEWKMACELYQCLKPFYTVTRNMSGENYPTGSLIIPLSTGLVSVCQNLRTKTFSKSVKTVADTLLTGVLERFGDFENSQTLTLLTFLDPRFKTLCFRDQNLGERVKHKAVNMVAAMNKPDNVNQDQDRDREQQEKEKSDDLSVFFNLDRLLSKKTKKGTSTSRAIVEVDRYLEDDLLDRKSNPIEWWKSEGHQYPQLKKLAQKYFCCLATSVPCERVFSKAGQFITDRRNKLKGNKAKMLMFLNHNENKSKLRKPWHPPEQKKPDSEEEMLEKVIETILSEGN